MTVHNPKPAEISTTLVSGALLGAAFVVFIAFNPSAGWAILGGGFAVISVVLFAIADAEEATTEASNWLRLVGHGLAIVAALITFALLFAISS